jgi:Zn-dependent oligopeptidase
VVDSIVNLSEPRTYLNTIAILHDVMTKFSTSTNNLTFFGYVSPNKALREAGKVAEEKLEKFDVDLYMRVDLFKALVDFKT